jgi:hypothetical protein
MSEGVVAGPALAEPQMEARDIIGVIATCRSARSTVSAGQSEGAEVGESALTVYVASCEKPEELGYSVEERSAELEIILNDDAPPYDGDVMVKAAAFLNPGSVPLNALSVVMDVRPVREQKVCCALVQHKPKEASFWWKICGGTGAHSHQGLIFFVDATSCTVVRRRRQAKFQPLRRILWRAVVNMVWESSNV